VVGASRAHLNRLHWLAGRMGTAPWLSLVFACMRTLCGGQACLQCSAVRWSGAGCGESVL
jgi:hypothetical protein